MNVKRCFFSALILFFMVSYSLAILFSWPLFVFGEEKRIIIQRFLFVLSSISFVFILLHNKISVNSVFITIIIVCILSSLSLKFNGLVYLDYVLILFIMPLFLDKAMLFRLAKIFFSMYVAIMVSSIAIYIAKHVFSIEHSGVIYHVNALKNAAGVYYKSYFNLLLIESYSYLRPDSFRFQSIFDEPGVVGTISGLLLIGFINVKARVQKAILVVSGVLSMSTAFFIYFVVSLIVSFVLAENKNKHFFNIIMILVVMAAVIFLIPNSLVDTFVDVVSRKYEGGDNRVSECFWNNFNAKFADHDFFGLGYGATYALGCDISSFFIQVYDYGVIGFTAIVFTIITAYIGVFNRVYDPSLASYDYKLSFICKSMFWLLLIFVNFYQRPNYFMPMYLIVGACFVAGYTKKIEDS